MSNNLQQSNKQQHRLSDIRLPDDVFSFLQYSLVHHFAEVGEE